MIEELKPCPFCGNHVRIWHVNGGYNIQCNVCGNGTITFIKLECAVEAWNRRIKNA
jgi:hypothetical protein